MTILKTAARETIPKITRLVLLVAAPGNRSPKTVHLQQLQGMQSSKQGMRKGYHLSIEGVRKGYHFREKWYIKVGPLGRTSPY